MGIPTKENMRRVRLKRKRKRTRKKRKRRKRCQGHLP
jgi:hypothetical protein